MPSPGEHLGSTRGDPLGEALHLLRLTGAVYARSDLTAPWGVDLPPLEGHMMFHVVTAGRCWLEHDLGPDGETEVALLERGSLALVPLGAGHRLVHEPGAAVQPFFDLPIERVTERYELLTHGGGGEACRLICVCVRFDHVAGQRLVAALPPVLTLDSWDGDDRWLADTLRFVAREAETLRPGGETVLTRLADILLIQMLRHWLEREAVGDRGWLAALRDPHLGRAIAAIHRDPGAPWTVATLAAEAAMSRSSFAARFTEVVGESAGRYLTRWRLALARAELRDTDAGILEVAERFGYGSEAAFGRAYKREFGVAPGIDRRAEPPPLVSA